MPGITEKEVCVGVRPEGFVPDADGPFRCSLRGVEVMGRDISVVSENPAALSPAIRAVINSEHMSEIGSTEVRFSLLPHKVFLFDRDTEERIGFRGTQTEAVKK